MHLALAGPYPPWRGGIAQFTMRLHDALSARAKVSRISYSRLYPRLLFPGSSQTDPGSTPVHEADVLLDSAMPLSWPRSRRRAAALGAEAALLEWWHPFFAPVLTAGMPPRGTLRRVAICHNVSPHEGFPLGERLTRSFLGSCSLLVVHSGPDEERAAWFSPGGRVLRLFHPVYDQYAHPFIERDEARSRLGIAPEERMLLYFGLVRPYKGLQDLLAAMPLLPPEVRLVAVGECYSGRRGIELGLSARGVAGRASWVDRFVGDDEVGLYFRAADAVVLPYRSASQSGVAQIAIAFGKPLVLTRTGGLPELVEEGVTGTLAEPGDPASLADAVSRCLAIAADPETPSRIGSLAARFGWEEYASRLLEALA